MLSWTSQSTIKEDILWLKWYTNNKQGKVNKEQIAVQNSMRSTIFVQWHEAPSGGHLCRQKTLAKIKPRFYLTGMDKEKRKGCASCYIVPIFLFYLIRTRFYTKQREWILFGDSRLFHQMDRSYFTSGHGGLHGSVILHRQIRYQIRTSHLELYKLTKDSSSNQDNF